MEEEYYTVEEILQKLGERSTFTQEKFNKLTDDEVALLVESGSVTIYMAGYISGRIKKE